MGGGGEGGSGGGREGGGQWRGEGGRGAIFDDKFVYVNIVCFDVGVMLSLLFLRMKYARQGCI